MWTLTTLNGDGSHAQVFRLLPGTDKTLGRAPGADFIVEAALVSRVHCRLLSLADGSLEVRDLQSTNGTYVNGQRIVSARLADGDRLQVGRVELLIQQELPAAAG